VVQSSSWILDTWSVRIRGKACCESLAFPVVCWPLVCSVAAALPSASWCPAPWQRPWWG